MAYGKMKGKAGGTSGSGQTGSAKSATKFGQRNVKKSKNTSQQGR